MLPVGFKENIVNISEVNCIILRIISCCGSGASILMNLIPHQTAIIPLDARLEEDKSKEKRKNKSTNRLNFLRIGGLTIGLIVLIIFVGKNYIDDVQ